MKQIQFVFALHNHQPVGNFDHVIEEAYQKSYKAFLDVFEQHPTLQAVMHNSGCLAQWIHQHHPEYFDRLRALVSKGQLEIMGGGFYEPILTVIPERDVVGQIQMLSRFVEETTGQAPTGMWCTERVWEPQLPTTMARSKIGYTVLDDSHFFASGLTEQQTHGYYMTEDAGNAVAVFPTSEKLRYLIPFGKVSDVIEWLRDHASEDESVLAILGDDGEKFGVWPKTYEHVYEKGWLKEFFQALEENSDWIKTTTFSRALNELKPRGRIYLPTASYIEMMTWALPTDSVLRFEEFYEDMKEERPDFREIQPFLRGGFWRNFLAKYDESNQMHKRAIRLSGKVEKAMADARTQKESERMEQARDLLWQGQCNCAYWHGVFGGLYLPHLRTAVFDRLNGADALIREGWDGAVVECVDFDGDGFEDVFIETPSLTLCLNPSYGGAFTEIDDLRTRANISDTLTRRRESYHAKVSQAVTWDEDEDDHANTEGATASIHEIVRTKEKGLERLLIYDWYRRCFGYGRFLSGWTTLQDFASGDYHEDGDFVNQPFEVESARVLEDGVPEVALVRHGGLYQEGGKRSITLRRTIRAEVDQARFSIRNEIINNSEMQASALFGYEMLANVLAPDAPDRYFFFSGSKSDSPEARACREEVPASSFGVVDEWRDLRIQFDLDQPARIWRVPIETVSLSEAGFERVYQGTCILPLWPIDLQPGERVAFEVTVRMDSPRAESR